jgi:hypothetical protein
VAEAIELTATAAVEDKRRVFAETRLMSRGPTPCKEPVRFAVWRLSVGDVRAGYPKLDTSPSSAGRGGCL